MNGRFTGGGALSAATRTAAARFSDAKATRSRVGSRQRAHASETVRESDTGRGWRDVRECESASSRERASLVWRALDECVDKATRNAKHTWADGARFSGFGGVRRS